MNLTDEQLRMIQLAIKGGIAEGLKEFSDQLQQLRGAIGAINARLGEGDATMKNLATDLEKNNESTEEMRSMFETAKKGFAFIGGLGTAAKWLIKVAGPIYGVYLFIKGIWGGHPPPPTK